MSYMDDLRKRSRRGAKKGRIILGVALIIIIGGAALTLNSSSFKRSVKSIWSDVGGGLNRTVTVYDYNGNPIKEYTGKFDIQENDTKVFFDMDDGRRVNIYNAIVIVEENIE